MSLERAAVNCNRCYLLARRYHEKNYSKIKVAKDDLIYTARNESIRSLESVAEQIGNQAEIKELCKSKLLLIGKIMRACVNCDYSSPISKNSRAYKNFT